MTKATIQARYNSAVELIREQEPEEVVYCVRPRMLRRVAGAFQRGFPGRVLYAVKCNPEPAFIDSLVAGGVTSFDVASADEVSLIDGLVPDGMMGFMHPVKARFAIRDAYFRHGLRHFVIDTHQEWEKLKAETHDAADVVPMVRLAMPRGAATYDLGGKFGATPEEAADLINRVTREGYAHGVCFHVGSQCLEVSAYERAFAVLEDVLSRITAKPIIVDVGGGFPAAYEMATVPPLATYFEEITRSLKRLGIGPETEIWCEPGRALAAPGASVLVRVELRKGEMLYINDGIYGSLWDLQHTPIIFPMRALNKSGEIGGRKQAFKFYGPTCDSNDVMLGPYYLPDTIDEGDWIEIGQVGAYSMALRTSFNGFRPERMTTVQDEGPKPSNFSWEDYLGETKEVENA